jgi:hypothetical protein
MLLLPRKIGEAWGYCPPPPKKNLSGIWGKLDRKILAS